MEIFEYLSLFLSLLTFLPLLLSVFRSLVDFTLLPAFHFTAFYPFSRHRILPELQTF